MRLEGQVTNIELYGAFVDVGAERDGLVHISQISEQQVNRVADVLDVGDQVTVWVRGVDSARGRIDLTMVEPPERSISELEPEQVVTGKVTKLAPYGAFVDIGVERDGLIHISEMAEGHTNTPSEVVQVGDEIEVRVVKVNHRRHRIELSLLGLPSEEDGEEIEEDEGEEPLTAMELAWKDAMEREGTSLHVSTHRRGRRKRKAEIRRQQAAIIARTLNTKED
jgi:transcriptional accessory protein Tex/SPT6